ncbi:MULTISPECIES: hypothetical protein [unclassified Dietzia]|nr:MULTISPECIES: hypothetical protein [unclassified Dietzia]QGW26440.1 hypothetical protein GJR88_05225 [Dietzia sp. DQ12-45-1b]
MCCPAIAEGDGSLRDLDLALPGVDQRIAEETDRNVLDTIFDAEGVVYR